MIVRRITANLFGRSLFSRVPIRRSNKAFAAITNAAGQFYALPTEAFEDYQGTDASRYIFEIPPLVPGSAYCSVPFPEAITAVGAYSILFYYQDQRPDSVNNQDYSSGRLIRPPEPSTVLGHYSAKQPPYGAVLDTSLYATRSLTGAWPLTGGVAPIDLFNPRSLIPHSRLCFTLSKNGGRTCALIEASGSNSACSLKSKKGFSRTWTLMDSIRVVTGEQGSLLAFCSLALLKTRNGYLLKSYLHEFADFLIPEQSDDFHRWVFTYTGPSRPDFPYVIPPVLSIYCDGDLLGSVNFTPQGSSLPGLDTVYTNLSLGSCGPQLGIVEPCCPAYHENVFYHNRALGADEVAQDSLTPYQWYTRPQTFRPASSVSGR